MKYYIYEELSGQFVNFIVDMISKSYKWKRDATMNVIEVHKQ